MGNKVFYIRYIVIWLITLLLISGTILASDNQLQLMKENEYLQLYINKSTTEVAVKDIQSGKVWYTNPPDRDEYETAASKFNKEKLGAQLEIKFFTPGDRIINWDNLHESIAYNQFTIKEIDRGIRIEYLIGKKWKLEDYIPVMSSRDFFENELQARLNDKEKEFIKDKFWLCYLEKREPEELKDYSYTEVSAKLEEKELFKEYVMMMVTGEGQKIELTRYGKEKDFPAFMKQNALKSILGKVVQGKNYMFLSDLKHEDILVFQEPVYILSEGLMTWDIEDLGKLFQEKKLSPYSIAEQHENYNIEIPRENIRLFNIPLEYLLEGRNLVVQIPLDEVKYPDNVIDTATGYEVTMPLVSINVLPYFGAGTKEDNGYILVPDGSGALINLNNGKVDIPEYHKAVYGMDKTLAEMQMQPGHTAPVRMPVFGLKEEDQAFLGVIESGEALAEIRAKVANNLNSYNAVYSLFNVLPYSNMRLVGVMDKGTAINIYQARLSQGSIKIRYFLLNEDQASYSGMASIYRSYLQEEYDWKRNEPERNLPLILEVMGSYHKVLPRLGIPRRTVIPLATFAETKELLSRLEKAGLKNMNLLYNGWLRGGPEHIFPDMVKVEKNVGGDSGLKELALYLKENDIDFFAEVNFLNVYNNSPLDGFSWFKDGARFLEGGQAKDYKYNRATFRWLPGKSSYLLSPRKLGGVVESFLKDYEQYNLTGIGLKSLGEVYYSDFRKNKKDLIDREQSLNIIKEQLKIISNRGHKILVRGGNIPSLSEGDYVVEAPMYGGADNLTDRGIPFYQMVLHGFLKYSGEPLNLVADPRREFLKMIETGAIPYFRGSYHRSDYLKYSDFNENYALFYKDWQEEAVDFYQQANKVLTGLQDQLIIYHEMLANNVYETIYENGTSIIVNYNDHSVNIGNQLIEGNSYKVFQEGRK